MIAVLQRVSRARVEVEGEVAGAIERGLLVLLGVEDGDGDADARALARKVASLRVFPGARPMDLDLQAVGGSVLLVSQFTLAASLDRGRRPGFERAAAPDVAEGLYARVFDELCAVGVPVERGRFGAHMEVSLLNDGPVTLLLQSRDGKVRALG